MDNLIGIALNGHFIILGRINGHSKWGGGGRIGRGIGIGIGIGRGIGIGLGIGRGIGIGLGIWRGIEIGIGIGDEG